MTKRVQLVTKEAVRRETSWIVEGDPARYENPEGTEANECE